MVANTIAKPTESFELSKIDVAKRELEHALRLFFSGGDPVIVHLVVSSAQQIMHDLCRLKGITTFLDEMLDMVKPERVDEVRKIFKRTYNFMKHADTDHDKLMPFNPEINETALLLAINMYFMLTKERTGLMSAFLHWFSANHPEFLQDEKDRQLIRDLVSKYDFKTKLVMLEVAELLERRRTTGQWDKV